MIQPVAVDAAPEAPPRSVGPTRRRLSRTFSRSRWKEYEDLLSYALAAGYRVLPLEEWLLAPTDHEALLLLRHDVDQAPNSALTMSDVEQRLGVRSSWYFRWRTADARVLKELRLRGSTIGFHYETLSRRMMQSPHQGDAAIGSCREELRMEIAQFSACFGAVRSVCAHGDTRVPGVRNMDLLEGQDPKDFGIELDVDRMLREMPLGAWLTDRSRAEGRWKPGMNPQTLVDQRSSPLLCLTHPNNWISGPGLWKDRILSSLLPASRGRRVRLIRTGSDTPFSGSTIDGP
jgi:hypothetical protein